MEKETFSIYQDMYYHLFRDISKALTLLAKGDTASVDDAIKTLQNTQCKTEEIYMNHKYTSSDDNLYENIYKRINLRILYAAFNQAAIDGLIKTNPVIGISVHGKQNKEYSEEFLFLTEEEISDLLHFISEQYPRLLGITFMGAYYGLRCSEILGLKWSAINFKKKTISINHTVVRVKTTSAEDSTKTQSSKKT